MLTDWQKEGAILASAPDIRILAGMRPASSSRVPRERRRQMLLFGPYLMNWQIGFILNAVGIMLITPQVYYHKQWNLVFLKVVSSTGYWLQIFNII